MKIFLGADHNGFKLKEEIKKYLKNEKIDFKDLGNFIFEPEDDYPDFAFLVAKNVAKKNGRGILICGSGEGMVIAANKIKKIRAAVAYNARQVKIFRRDNNINILCLAAWETNFKKAKEMIKAFLETKFSALSRHKRRLQKIRKIEKSF
ncbi:MAG: RpiB/LacA/LacB family sugar-phosphate isomerase [Minisyncoccales bacterium]